MGDSENDVVLGNTGPSGDNNAAYGNFEVGSRFLQVSEQETSEFIKNNRNKNTARKTEGNVKILYNWLTDVCTEARKLYEIPPPELNMYLARFFLSVRRPGGSEYEPETLRGYLGSFARHLRENGYQHNIVESHLFSHAREVLVSKRKQLKSQGKGNRKRKAEPLAHEDFIKLRESNQLGSGNPRSLVNTMYINNTMHFGLRGRHEHEQMLWGDINLKTDSTGTEYLEFNERATKTRNGTGNIRPFPPKMFAIQDDPLCPVKIYKEYLRRRPQDTLTPESRFYLAVKQNPDDVWFKRQPMGKNSIGSIVKNMTTAAGINDRRLTNHSIRKTTVTNLLEAGFQPTEVMQITGHKNVQSINNYSHLPIKKQKEMSAVLSETSTVPSVQPHLSDEFEEMSDEYLSQAVEVIESTHLDLAATTVDVSSTATIVDLPIQFDSNGTMTLQSQEKKMLLSLSRSQH